MLITREMLVKRLSEESGYWMKDVRALLQCMDDVILELFGEVTDDEDVSIQLIRGIKVGCSIQPERERRDPRTQEVIVCAPTCKPNAKFSQDFRELIQKQYEEKKDS